MPKDPEAIAAIDELFEKLLGYLKSNATRGQDEFEAAVHEKLENQGKKVLGYKKTLKYMLENFAQHCGTRKETGGCLSSGGYNTSFLGP